MTLNLLIVDDDIIANFINTRVAEKSGLFSEIRSVSSGQSALEIFSDVCNGTVAPPDILLLDLHMAGMSGFDFIEALKSFSYPKKDRLRHPHFV
jgi:CheY-like chemotaxis protein